MSDTSTRSGMLWEVERILTECHELGELPQILLMENVPMVHSTDNMADFHKWQVRLEELGYKSYWQDLIATDFGIPQTRNRCFMVSILGDYSYTFPQPTPLKLKLKDMLEDNVEEKYYLSDKQLNDIQNWNAFEKPLETIDKDISKTLTTRTGAYCAGMQLVKQIDKKYYLSNKMKDYITSKDDKYKVNENKLVINRDIACSKTTREGWTRADTSDYICRELPENANILKIKNATKQGYLEANDGDGVDISSRMEYHRGTVQKGMTQTITTMGGENNGVVVNMKRQLCNELVEQGKIKENDVIRHSYTTSRTNDWEKRSVEQNNLSPTLDTRCDCLGVCVKEVIPYGTYYTWKDNQGNINTQCNRAADENRNALTIACANTGNVLTKSGENDLRIRKLTPRECFRLMGVKDEDFDKVSKNQSDASLYHLAGDSIVVNVLMAIFKQLL